MPTQLSPTPVLRGRDALAVLEQVRRKCAEEEKRKARERELFFAGLKKRGLD